MQWFEMYSHGAAEVGRAEWAFFDSIWDASNRNCNRYENASEGLVSSTKVMDENTFHQVFTVDVANVLYTFVGHFTYDGKRENFASKITWEGCTNESAVTGADGAWNECASEEGFNEPVKTRVTTNFDQATDMEMLKTDVRVQF